MVLVGTKYKNADIASRYDAIVIGSGMSGLTAAALLSKAGKKTLVVEQHYTAGGFTHSYLRKGFEWDVGVHYIGEVHKKNSPMRRAFDFITEGRLQWAEMGEVYDSIIIGDERYDFRVGRKRWRDDMAARFPGEEAAIDAYLRKVDIVNNITMPAFVSDKMAPGFMSGAFSGIAGAVFTNYFQRTTLEVLSELTQNKKLIGVLVGQWGDYGAPPAKSSFAMHALVANHYFDGGNFPVGGSSEIARSIVPTITKAGGLVVVEAPVQDIIVENNRALGIRLEDGREVRAEKIISAAGFHNTCMRMLPEEIRAKYGFRDQAKKVNSSIGHLGLYIGLNESAADLKLPKGNLWLYPDCDHDENMRSYQDPDSTFPVVYISFPSSKDPSWEKRHPGKSTIEVVVPAPYEWFEKWENEPWRKRGKEYEEFKTLLSDRILEYVYEQVPQVKGKISYHELSTPLSTRYFSNYSRGELYGLEHTPERFAQAWLRPRTPVDNLYMTGQDILCCGVGSAMVAGIMTATSILGPGSVSLLPDLIRGRGAMPNPATETEPQVEPAREKKTPAPVA